MLREAMEETGIVPTEYFLLADDLYARPSEGSKLWVKAPDGWRVYAYLVTRWQGSIPTHTLDDHHSPLSWIDPKKVVRDEGSTEFSRNVEVAQRIIMWEVVA
jgi:8-oxo-dGTP pyrophosphatase MutT (NUDIX family)